MTQPLLIDPDQIGDAAAGWGALTPDFASTAPEVSGDWPTQIAVRQAIDSAADATKNLQDGVNRTADDTQSAAGQYRDVDNDSAKDLLGRVKVIPDEPSVSGYDRKCDDGHSCSFGEAWHDGQNACDTRDRILRRDLTDVKMSPDGCHVVGGWEHDPYTGKVIGGDKNGVDHQIQIDHIYPLHRAWEMGAGQWSQDQRVAFANDPDNLLPVSAGANESKGDQGPGTWLPPNEAERLDYVDRYLRVADRYHLPITQAEHDAIQSLVGGN
jgi:hypothetical protein